MSKCRVYYKPDKTVAIVRLSPKTKLPEAEAYAKTEREVGLVGLPYDDMDTLQLPQSRENRNAWEGEKGKSINVNPNKIKLKTKTFEERVTALENAK